MVATAAYVPYPAVYHHDPVFEYYTSEAASEAQGEANVIRYAWSAQYPYFSPQTHVAHQ